MTNNTERERLIKQLDDKYCKNATHYDDTMFSCESIADFILADRRRVLEEIEKPLKAICP